MPDLFMRPQNGEDRLPDRRGSPARRFSGEEMDPTFIQSKGRILGERIAPWFMYCFYFAGTVVHFSTSIGIMDYVSRLSASELKISFFPRSETVTESRTYTTFVVIFCVLTTIAFVQGLLD